MALTFLKKLPPQDDAPAPSAPKSSNDDAPPKASEPAKKTTGSLGFLKKGESARKALEQEEARKEAAKEDASRLFRFWMEEGDDRKITFLDGKVDEHGLLDIPMFEQHNIKMNGKYHDFVCTADTDQTQPCPICESGDRAALCGVMTIIDHTPYTIKKGDKAGKVVKNQRKLFVAKHGTIKLLTKLAIKRGGLAGCTFDVSRTGEKEPRVGDTFDFVEKFESKSAIAEKYDMKVEDLVVADYEFELNYKSPEELLALGVGKAVTGPGTQKAKDLSDQL